MKIETKYVSPEMAEQMLGTSAVNRKVLHSRVQTLANEMRTGQWKMNGETIIFTEDGRLVDGQHRLWAIMESGCTIQMLIVRGADNNAFETIDTGRSRTGADVAGMAGITNAISTVAGAALLYRIWHGLQISQPVPPHISLRVIDRYPTIEKWSSELAGGHYPLSTGAFITALVYLEEIAGKALAAKRFFDGITSGASLPDGDPLLTLRNRLISMRASNHRVTPGIAWTASAKTLSALEAGETNSRLLLNSVAGVALKPALWNEHVTKLPASKSLSDLRVSVLVRDMPAREGFQTKVTEIRSRAANKT